MSNHPRTHPQPFSLRSRLKFLSLLSVESNGSDGNISHFVPVFYFAFRRQMDFLALFALVGRRRRGGVGRGVLVGSECGKSEPNGTRPSGHGRQRGSVEKSERGPVMLWQMSV